MLMATNSSSAPRVRSVPPRESSPPAEAVAPIRTTAMRDPRWSALLLRSDAVMIMASPANVNPPIAALR